MGGDLNEPYRLREWAVPKGRLFTMGRPGRSKYGDRPTVPPHALDAWVRGLPAGDLLIVSLLGTKPGPPLKDEFSYYPFTGGLTPDPKKPSLETWLNSVRAEGNVRVVEVPTMDLQKVPLKKLAAAGTAIRAGLDERLIVLVMDSGGWTRTSEVCGFMGFKLITDPPPRR